MLMWRSRKDKAFKQTTGFIRHRSNPEPRLAFIVSQTVELTAAADCDQIAR